MKFTLSWLKKFLDTQASLNEIAEALTQLGLEVEEIINREEELKVFEVAEIIKTTPHPSADKLKICEVKTKDKNLQIICGAQNARAGIKVVLAPIGSEIPNDKFKIKESEIRGVKSMGMLCSEAELLVGSNSSGIIELPLDAKVGDSPLPYFGLDDPIIHIEVTPNRPDALGVYGIARDLAAKGLGQLKKLAISEIEPAFHSSFNLKINDQEACPLFSVCEIKNLKNIASPDWLKKLLKNIGINPISAIVDITNYISYSFGQPMHAYDADKLTGNLEIELLNGSQKFHALNDKEYILQSGDLTIKDKNSIQCLAGIIGGEISACNEETTRIILEAAYFDPITISKSGRNHQIITDSRYRFERNVDQAFTIKALNIAINMILSICGGDASQIIIAGNNKVEKRTLKFPVDFFEKATGLSIQAKEICTILEKLGFELKSSNNNILELTIPSWRPDISIKQDIVEEVLRIYEYNKLPEVPLPSIEISQIFTKEQRRILDCRRILANSGYDEVVTWSFISSEQAKLFEDLKEELTILNPISSDLDYMRPSIIPGLLKVTAKNMARNIKNLSLFEIGPIFLGVKPEEELTFAAGIRGGINQEKNCHSSSRLVDVFDVKGDLELLFSYLGISLDKCQINPTTLSYYHPSKSASLTLGKNILATFGYIHPRILKYFDIEQEIIAFEINIKNIPFGKAKFGKKEELLISDYQTVARDYAFIVQKDQAVGEILTYIKNIDKKLIKAINLFDIYMGDKLTPGTKSIALSVTIQSDEKTLAENDLNMLSQNIITSVEQKFNAKLRTA